MADKWPQFIADQDCLGRGLGIVVGGRYYVGAVPRQRGGDRGDCAGAGKVPARDFVKGAICLTVGGGCVSEVSEVKGGSC